MAVMTDVREAAQNLIEYAIHRSMIGQDDRIWAYNTILDSNLTTFLVAFILFAIGTGPIKGFAVTLMIGIICSMFTAITVTRAVVQLIYGKKRNLHKLSI